MPDRNFDLDPNRSVNSTILAHPDTLSVFSVFGLDTCCRGNLSVADAVRDANLDLAVVIKALKEAIVQDSVPANTAIESR